MKRLKSSFPELLILLCLLFWFCWPSLASASESEHYTITEQELTRLELNLSRLNTLNHLSQVELAKAQKKLEISEKKCEMLETRLAGLEAMSIAQENSLRIANESLTAFAKEEKAKLNKIKRQRNIAYIICGCLIASKIK